MELWSGMCVRVGWEGKLEFSSKAMVRFQALWAMCHEEVENRFN